MARRIQQSGTSATKKTSPSRLAGRPGVIHGPHGTGRGLQGAHSPIAEYISASGGRAIGRHRKRDCTNEDRSKHCLQGTETGHKAKVCRNPPSCIVCKAEGHRLDQQNAHSSGSLSEVKPGCLTLLAIPTEMTIEILQTNLVRPRVAHDLTYPAALKRNIDIRVVGKPNKKQMESQVDQG
ncbi:hypothetical protein JTB14_007472 [Gonioctena quinquepunctata]|nr:hypothetical protein JTB14_007472 [Gonioctena quinquepunctata]